MSQSSRPIDEGAALSDAEWRVMQALWDRGPCRARVVLDELEAETGWSYSTVKTLLARLVALNASRWEPSRGVPDPAACDAVRQYS